MPPPSLTSLLCSASPSMQTRQLQELEKSTKELGEKVAEAEMECRQMEGDIAQLKHKLTTSYRSRMMAAFPAGIPPPPGFQPHPVAMPMPMMPPHSLPIPPPGHPGADGHAA